MEEEVHEPNPDIQTAEPTHPVVKKPKKRFHIPKFVLLIVFFLILLGLMEGGAYLYKNSVNKQTKDTPLGSPKPTAQAATPYPTAWETYTNTKYKYSVEYPGNWFNLENSGAPDTDKYFSNQNVNSPLEMKIGGIWTTIRVEENSDFFNDLFNAQVGKIISDAKSIQTKLADLNINGNKTVKYISETPPGSGTEYAYTVNFAVKKDDQIFNISFLTFNKTEADKNMDIFDQILSTFTFTNANKVSSVDTSDWKSYRANGFLINYPPDYTPKEEITLLDDTYKTGNTVTFNKEGSIGISIISSKNIKKLNIENALGNGPVHSYTPDCLGDFEPDYYKIDDVDAIGGIVGCGISGEEIDIIWFKGDKIYQAGGRASDYKILLKMLATFQFTE